jgi:hypothetical protein
MRHLGAGVRDHLVVMTGERSDQVWRAGAPTWPGAAWERIASRAYAGIRDGNLGVDDAFDLACFLMEWAQPHRLFHDLAAASVEASDPDRMADLAGQVLAAVDYVPDFGVEPRLLAGLEQVLAKVVPDLRATGQDGRAEFVVLDGAEPPHAYVRYQDSFGHTSGLAPRHAAQLNPVAMLVLVADELQDAVIDSLHAVWPVCATHQLGAHPRAIGGQAVWWCAGDNGHVIAAIGKLK